MGYHKPTSPRCDVAFFRYHGGLRRRLFAGLLSHPQELPTRLSRHAPGLPLHAQRKPRRQVRPVMFERAMWYIVLIVATVWFFFGGRRKD